MPQVFQVLKCFKCSVFQVHQTKKSNKFECKLCGEKQSMKRHYGLGDSKECRLHVQKLNGIRKDIDEFKNLNSDDSVEEDEIKVEFNANIKSVVTESKWSKFVDKSEQNCKENDDKKQHLHNLEVVFEIPKKKPNKRLVKYNKKTYDSQDDDQTYNDSTVLPQVKKVFVQPKTVKSQATLSGNTFSSNQNNALENAVKESDSFNLSTPKQTKLDSKSKWAHYVDEEYEDIANVENLTNNCLNNLEVVFETPNKRPNKRLVKDNKRTYDSHDDDQTCNDSTVVPKVKKVFVQPKTVKSQATLAGNTSLSSKNNALGNAVKESEFFNLSTPKQTKLDSNSKWSHYVHDEYEDIDNVENLTNNYFIEDNLKSNHNSKWSELKNDDADYPYEKEDKVNLDNLTVNPQKLFSLCDDEDIDDVLDI